MHEFHAKGYLVPDKTPSLAKETKLTKRKVTHGVEVNNFDEADVDDTNYDNDVPDSDHKKSKKAPSFAGELVLEPKKGLYDKYVLLLDFNSLYPSIIQVDNILFQNMLGFSIAFSLLGNFVCFIYLSMLLLIVIYDSFY